MPPPQRPEPYVALYERAMNRIPDLARRTVARLVEEVPLYGLLPREQLDGEITDLTANILRLVLSCMRDGRALSSADLEQPAQSAARRAEEEIPLDAINAGYHVGARMAWHELASVAKEEETPALIAAVEPGLRFLQQITTAVSAAYVEEQKLIYGEQRDARRALVAALLSGTDSVPAAERAGVALESSYVVLSFSLSEPPPPETTGTGAAVAGRRRVRRMQAALDHFAGSSVLSSLDGYGGIALLPSANGLPDLLGKIEVATGVPVTGAAAAAQKVDDIPAALREATDVRDLVIALGRPPAVYRLDDVLLEYQVTRPGGARDGMIAALAPVADQPHLLEALEMYVRNGQQRRQTAEALHVHPNTLDYRLRRVHELTGLDPTEGDGLRLLAAALTARRFAS